MDDFIKQLIVNNKLTLTLLAMVFAPLGLMVAWRRLNRDSTDTLASPDVNQRLDAIERTLGLLVSEITMLRDQQQRLPGRTGSQADKALRPPRINTPS